MANAKRDLTKLSAIQGFTRWLLKESGALLVVVIRVDDLVITADAQLKPEDSQHLLEDRMPELHQMLQAERVEARAKAERMRSRDEKRALR